jgi:hypothetical protein
MDDGIPRYVVDKTSALFLQDTRRANGAVVRVDFTGDAGAALRFSQKRAHELVGQLAALADLAVVRKENGQWIEDRL